LAQRFADSDEAYYVDTLGWLQFRLGEVAEAISLLRRAVAMAPEDPQLRYHLAAALHAAEEAERALAELDRAVVAEASYPGLDEARRLKATLEARREAVAAE
jgi:Flp pilus assembly protein TadD